jgi:CubicO group peptidase (beta-lactamase class C family)
MRFRKLVFFFWLPIIAFRLFCQDLPREIDSLCRSNVKPNEPGFAIAVRKGGKILLEKGYGLADLRRTDTINAETPFNIGSLTKQYTAAAILHLVQEGRISLDDRIIRFFPDFDSGVGSKITVGELLSHSSGIMDHYDHVDTTGMKHASCADVLKAVKKLSSTYFYPGKGFRYSNTGYCVLAMIIEKVTGQTYTDYIHSLVIKPLGLKHSMIWNVRSRLDGQATGYDYNSPRGFLKEDADDGIFFSTEGDGGMYTSIKDYLVWYNSLASGNLLNIRLRNEAWSRQVLADTVSGISYGYGWFIRESSSDKFVYHTGSNGGFRAIVWSVPARNDLIVIFCNRTGLDLEGLVLRISQLCGFPAFHF